MFISYLQPPNLCCLMMHSSAQIYVSCSVPLWAFDLWCFLLELTWSRMTHVRSCDPRVDSCITSILITIQLISSCLNKGTSVVTCSPGPFYRLHVMCCFVFVLLHSSLPQTDPRYTRDHRWVCLLCLGVPFVGTVKHQSQWRRTSASSAECRR